MTAVEISKPGGCWVIDRKISLGFILALLIHAVAVVGWLVRMEGRVGELERTDMRHDAAMVEMQRVTVSVAEMKSDISWMRENMARFHSQK